MSATEQRPAEQSRITRGNSVSRREFLKLAGVAGAVVGAGAGLGGLLAACGGGTTTTTAATTATTAAPTSTTAGGVADSSTTTVSAAVEGGAPIKIGFVTPKTGGLAAFGVPDGYTVDRVNEWIGDGQVLGDQKKHAISIEVRDTQSDVTRAGQVAGELIGNNIQIMCVGSGPDTVNPVSDQCEANGTPCVATDDPWQAFIFGRQGAPDKAFNWTYLYFFGVEDIVADYTQVWTAIPTNKVMGVMWPNDADGASFSDPKTGFPPVITAAGFTIVDPGRWQDGSEDFTAEISMFKKAGAEVLSGVFNPPDFTNFWKQCKQQAWYPKIATVDKAILFPQSIEALGPPPIGVGLISGDWWDPNRPWKSYLTGQTCKEWADDYTARTKQEWTQPLMHVVTFEMAIWALQHATDPTSKDAINSAIKQMKFTSIGGDMDFSAPVATDMNKPGQSHVHPNVYKSPACAGQWIQGTNYPYDYVVVSNAAAPMVSVGAQQIPVATA
jgi:branched-chain amino acid transport system substrate-binding protein